MLNRKVIRGSIWALFALVLAWGSGHAAYLPSIGPTPIRFLPPPRQVDGGRNIAVKLPSASAGNGNPVSNGSNNDWISDVVLPDGFDPYRPYVSQAAAAPSQDYQTPDQNSSQGNTRQVVPQELVPYFAPGNQILTNQPSRYPIEFVPPVRTQVPSSTAIYTRH